MKKLPFIILTISILILASLLIACGNKPSNIPHTQTGEDSGQIDSGLDASEGDTTVPKDEGDGIPKDYSVSSFCDEPDVDSIALCDEWVRVRWTDPSKPTSYFKRPATEVICEDDIDPDKISDECLQLLSFECFDYSCPDDSSTKDSPAKEDVLVGGDKDEHGCIGSAGYQWCEAKGKCLRAWEEDCEGLDVSPEVRARAIAGEFIKKTDLYSLYGGQDLQFLDVQTAKCPGCFTIKAYFTVENEFSVGLRDRVIMTIDIDNWVASESSSDQVALLYMTSDDCDYEDGEIFPLAKGCPSDYDELGDIEDAPVPSLCCAKEVDYGI